MSVSPVSPPTSVPVIVADGRSLASLRPPPVSSEGSQSVEAHSRLTLGKIGDISSFAQVADESLVVAGRWNGIVRCVPDVSESLLDCEERASGRVGGEQYFDYQHHVGPERHVIRAVKDLFALPEQNIVFGAAHSSPAADASGVRIWDTRTGKLRSLECSHPGILRVAVSRRRPNVVFSGASGVSRGPRLQAVDWTRSRSPGTAPLWQVSQLVSVEQRVVRQQRFPRKTTYFTPGVEFLEPHDESGLIYANCGSGTFRGLQAWDVRNLTAKAVFSSSEAGYFYCFLKRASKGHDVVCGASDGSIHRFDFRKGLIPLQTWRKCHRGDCEMTMTENPASGCFITGSEDRTVKCWRWDKTGEKKQCEWYFRGKAHAIGPVKVFPTRRWHGYLSLMDAEEDERVEYVLERCSFRVERLGRSTNVVMSSWFLTTS